MTLPRPRMSHRVTGWNGVTLNVPEWGDPNGQPLVLVHGWSQAHQSWARQLDGALDQFRIIAPDLRGHGASDKPDTPEHYNHAKPWADDIAAIVAQLGLENAVLVGWSMGGWVVQDYLRHHGDAKLAGIALVGTSVQTGSHLPQQAREARADDPAVVAAGMNSDETSENLAATLAFVKACFHQQPGADDLALMVGFNMLCPPHVRQSSRSRSEDYTADLAKLSAPALVQWGTHERLAVSPMPQDLCAALPNVTAIEYANSGHAPFWEEAEQFNRDLARFAAHARKGKP